MKIVESIIGDVREEFGFFPTELQNKCSIKWRGLEEDVMTFHDLIKFYFPAATDQEVEDFLWILPFPFASANTIESDLKDFACKANSIGQAIYIGYGEFDRIMDELRSENKKSDEDFTSSDDF